MQTESPVSTKPRKSKKSDSPSDSVSAENPSPESPNTSTPSKTYEVTYSRDIALALLQLLENDFDSINVSQFAMHSTAYQIRWREIIGHLRDTLELMGDFHKVVVKEVPDGES